jgi:hypothetical protein
MWHHVGITSTPAEIEPRGCQPFAQGIAHDVDPFELHASNFPAASKARNRCKLIELISILAKYPY